MDKLQRDTSAFGLTASPGTLTTPAGYTGNAAPVTGGTNPEDARLRAEKAVNSNSGMSAPASDEAESVKNTAATLVVGCVVLLWLLGGIVFKNAKL